MTAPLPKDTRDPDLESYVLRKWKLGLNTFEIAILAKPSGIPARDYEPVVYRALIRARYGRGE